MDYPKISIVTPSFNQAEFIEDTILSVINQQYPCLEYIIIDGGSTDGTIDIIRKYEDHITYWISEKDNGMYDALNKGFIKCSGEIMGWLNSDDILHRQSLFIIAEIFTVQRQVNWLQGYSTVIDHTGRILYHRTPRFSRYSFYLKEYHDGIFIQQESTYWRRNLWQMSGHHISQEYKYAGDFELWMRFYKYAELYTTTAMIGAFRHHRSGQASKLNYNSYIEECDSITDKSVVTVDYREKAKIKKLRVLKKIKQSFPFISKLLLINRYLYIIENKSKEVIFDFKDQQFHIYE